MRVRNGVDWLARWALRLMLANAALSVAVGIVAMVAWPAAGSGPGGGWGVPGMGYLLAAAMGVPSGLVGLLDFVRGRWVQAGRLLAFAGPAFVFIGFFHGSHLLDPCALGWLQPRSGFCEAWGGSWNVHTRYHLLHHALVPTVVLVLGYRAAWHRWFPRAV